MTVKGSDHVVLTLPGGDAPPTEFCVFKFGRTEYEGGSYDFDEEDAEECLKAFKSYGNRLTLDYEHMAVQDPPVISPAAGSFALAKRADGLYAVDVKWTAKASEMLKAKEYLYFSPFFVKNKAGRPQKLINVALTNTPATKHMQSLVAANLREVNKMKTVFEALSLRDSASEADALGAVMKLKDDHRRLVAAVGKGDADEAIGVVAALKAQAGEVQKLKAELAQVKIDQESAEVKALIDEAVRGGVDPAKRGELEAMAQENGIKALKTCLSLFPKAAPAAIPPGSDWKPEGYTAAGTEGITTSQLKIIKQMGIEPKDFAAHRAKYRAVISQTEEK